MKFLSTKPLTRASVFRKIKATRSLSDLYVKTTESLKLIYKLISGKYGDKYWEKQRIKNTTRWFTGSETLSSYGKKLMNPPYKVFWNWDIIKTCNYKCEYCFYHGCDNTGTLFLKPEIWWRI